MSGRNWQGTASGIMIGLGIGVGLGMLLAPKSGQEAREQLAGRIKEGLDGAIAQGENLSRHAQQSFEETRDRVKDLADVGQQVYRDVKSNLS
jgi:gas vesicle protein